MSDFIYGRKIIDTYEILPFEFLVRFIHNGLYPIAPQMGRPVEVGEFLTAVFNIQEMDNDADPRLEYYKDFIDANSKTDWPDFQLSGDAEIDQKINEALLEHIYDRKQYKKLKALDQMNRHGHPKPKPGIMAKPAIAAPKKPSKRPSRDHEEKCRERARRIWEVYPDMHPKQLSKYTAFRLQIVMEKEGKLYTDNTYKKWITDLWPEEHRYLGPAKDLNIPNAVIEELLQDFYK